MSNVTGPAFAGPGDDGPPRGQGVQRRTGFTSMSHNTNPFPPNP